MRVHSLRIKNHRNLKDEYIEFSKNFNVIYGDNAQGKTNILEAVWLLTGARSFRGVKDNNLIMFGEENSEITADIDFEDRNNTIKIKISNGKRTAEINGLNRGLATSIIGKFKAVIFYPEHLLLIKGGPENRRKLIDAAVCQIKPSYTNLLVRYNKALRNRNALLKNIKTFSGDYSKSLDIWDYKTAEYSGMIIYERIKYIKLLNQKAKKLYYELSSGEDFEVKYSSQDKFYELSHKEIFEDLLKQIRNARNIDINRGFTSIGAHRDELYIKINDEHAKLFGSQGQQRSAVISLKLAEAEIIRDLTMQMPVILLDDILSELDEKRQKYLFNNTIGAQTILTGCIKPKIDCEYDKKCKIFHVKGSNGKDKKIFAEE